MQQFLNEVRKIFPESSIITEEFTKSIYEWDWRRVFYSKAIAVIFPTNIRQIQQLIQLCLKFDIKITPQGGNTSKCGASVPVINSHLKHIIINLSKMNKIISIDQNNKSVSVESGCTLMQIQNFVDEKNLYFPLQLASSSTCQIGGNIATNAGGINVIKYGMMRDLILGIEVVLPDGTVVNQLKSLKKNNMYLDIKQLFIGSEGTLGIITKANLKLFNKPSFHLTFLSGTNSLENCIFILSLIQEKNLDLNTFEIINKKTQLVYNQYYQHIPIENDWIILGEFEYNSDEQKDHIQTILTDIHQASDLLIAMNEKEREYLWSIRKNIPIAEKNHGKAIKFDISLPISQIQNFVTSNYNQIKTFLLKDDIIIFGHLGDGNLHYNIPISIIENSSTSIEKITQITYSNVNKYNGSISAEHGIGQLKNKWFSDFCDNSSYNLMLSIKNLLDPQNIFNPGKVFNL